MTKVRITKKELKKEELNLAANLRDVLAELTAGDKIEGRWAAMLGSDLTFLTIWQLRLNSSFGKSGWWIDGIEWESLVREFDARVRGSGQLYWGYSNNLSALTPEPFAAELQLKRVGARLRVEYFLTGKINDLRMKLEIKKNNFVSLNNNATNSYF